MPFIVILLDLIEFDIKSESQCLSSLYFTFFVYKKQVYKRHEAQVVQKLRNTGRLSLKSIHEKSVFVQTVFIKLEAICLIFSSINYTSGLTVDLCL